jgi:DNA-binding XRE family transcriptional regulator
MGLKQKLMIRRELWLFMTHSLWRKGKQIRDVRARVGLNLQRLRREKGLSQEELADRAQIHQTYLSGVERGRRNPTITVLQRIAEALDADIADLMERHR